VASHTVLIEKRALSVDRLTNFGGVEETPTNQQ
jgi:hypothetical protein